VGAVPVEAMLVTPAATGQLLVQRLHLMMAAGAGGGALSSLIGLYLSYHADLATSAAVVLTATCFFLLAFLFSPRSGVLWPRRRLLGGLAESGD